MVNTIPWLLYLWERDPVPIVQKAGWGPRASLDEVENLAAIRIRSVDCEARRKSANALCNLRVSLKGSMIVEKYIGQDGRKW
jgi:hypothetical protein